MKLVAKTLGGAFLHGYVLGIITGVWIVATIFLIVIVSHT